MALPLWGGSSSSRVSQGPGAEATREGAKGGVAGGSSPPPSAMRARGSGSCPAHVAWTRVKGTVNGGGKRKGPPCSRRADGTIPRTSSLGKSCQPPAVGAHKPSLPLGCREAVKSQGQPARSGPFSLLGCKAVKEPGPQCPGVCLCSHLCQWQGTSSLELPDLEQPQGNQGNEDASETGNQMLRWGGGASPSTLQPDPELTGAGDPTRCACPWACRREVAVTQLRQILGGPGKPRQLLPGQPVRPPTRIPQVSAGWPGEAGEGSTRPHWPHPRCSGCQHPEGQPRVGGRKQRIRAWWRPWSHSARSRDKTPPVLTGNGTWDRQDGQGGSQAEPQKQKSRLQATS